MPAQSGNNTDAFDIESTFHPSIHLSRRRNLTSSPFLSLPTELILEIFVYVIGLDDDYSNYDRTLFVLTAICHQLREIGTASPQLWSSVDFTTPPIAKLFLERCKYNPRILLVKGSGPMWLTRDPKREVLWEELGGRTFNNLRSLVFDGSEREFAREVVSVLQRAPNVSNLDLNNIPYGPSQDLPWPIGDPIPNLSTLHLHNFLISWTSPLLRNLTQLTMDSGSLYFPLERVSVETFLTTLVNCPNLEILSLTNSGPETLGGRQDECGVVVQLCRLRELSLKFHDPWKIGCILSHIGYPESTRLAVYATVDVDGDLAEVISRILPHRNVQTTQHVRKSTVLTVYPDDHPQFFTDNLLVHLHQPHIDMGFWRNPQSLTRLAPKIVEVVGGDTIISLNIESWQIDLPEGMWGPLLHGLPRLERMRYRRTREGNDLHLANSFVLVFSRPFEGRPICPQLQHLEMPRGVLTHDSSARVLKRALTERVACGRRLKRIGISDDEVEVGDRLVLEPFRDVVDEVG